MGICPRSVRSKTKLRRRFQSTSTSHKPTLVLNLINNGTEAQTSLIPVFPTLTFPNHYSIITYLYPPHQGIINNFFIDPITDNKFTMASHVSKWWTFVAMFVSFCVGHFFVLTDKYTKGGILFYLYISICLPVTFNAAGQFPLFIDLIKVIWKKIPPQSFKGVHL